MFQGTMQSYPGLERWAKTVRLPENAIDLYYYDTAPTPAADGAAPVVFLHGLGDEADTWRHVLPLVMESRRAIAPDLPGFGRSDKPQRKYTIPFFVEGIRELLDVLGIQRAVLVGHSTGAVIAHSFALEHPTRVERLVLVGGSLVTKETKLDPALLLFLVPGVGEWLYNRLRKDPMAAYRSLEPYYHRLQDLPQADRDFLYQRVNERVWSDGQRRGFLSTLRNLVAWVPGQQKRLPERLRGWSIPTTILWGEDDRINAPANAQALVELLPSARLEIVPGAGHNLHQEQPEVVAGAVGDGAPTAGA